MASSKEKQKWQRSRPSYNGKTVASQGFPSFFTTPGHGGLPLKDDQFYAFGQVQAFILQNIAFGRGQAQADIKQTYTVSGQARAVINRYGFGQAQAYILVRTRVTSLALEVFGSDSTRTTRVTSHALEVFASDSTKTTRVTSHALEIFMSPIFYGTGQAQGYILSATKTAVGQAQADIKQTYTQSGQAQAFVIYIQSVTGQAQADIKQTYYVVGQSQSDIKQTYYGLGQAQADIKQVYSVCGQSQGDIKQTYFALGQAQARILQTYFGLGQSQADIKTTYYASGQAQASMGGINLVYAQAQADIKQTYYVFGQTQGQIKATYFGLGQAQGTIKQTYAQCGQAQGQIKNNYTASGQANADIKQTYTQSGQAQASIKQIYQQVAQSQSTIKTIYYVFGQAQAKIDTGRYAFGQAQGYLAFGYTAGYAQAQAWIAVQVLLDTFSRTAATGDGLGTPDLGPAYVNSPLTNYTSVGISGTEMVLVGNATYDWVGTDTGLALYDVMAQIDFQFVGDLQPWATFAQIDLRWNAYYQVYSYYYLNGDNTASTFALTYIGPNSEFGQTVSDPDSFVPAVNTWYTFKILAHKRDAYVKVWETGTPEPNWQLSLLDMQSTLTAGTIVTYADVGEPASFPAVMLYDNYQIFKLSEKLEQQVFGQALAEIKSPFRWGQAQALIDRPIRFGQAAARIPLGASNTTNPYQVVVIADGPAAYYLLDESLDTLSSTIAVDSVSGYNLTKAYPDLGYGPFGGYTGIPGTNGDTAIINHTPSTDQGFNYLMRYNQSIPITSATNWAVEFWINFETLIAAGGSTPILLVGNTDFNISGAIYFERNNTSGILTAYVTNLSNSPQSVGSFVPGNNNWTHIVLTRGTGNFLLYVNGSQISSSTISGTFGNPSNTVFISPSPTSNNDRFYMDELALYTHQLAADRVLEHYFTGIGFRQWYGQAQARIIATNVNRFGQAQAYMRLYVGYAQAQAKIKAIGVTNSGQAQASITRLQKNAHSQALIVVTGIQTTGQARAVIVWVTRKNGQAQAKIKSRTIGTGQAMAYMRNPRGFGQAQAYIHRPERWASGQAQAVLIRPYTQWFVDSFTRNTPLGVLFPPNPDYGTYGISGVLYDDVQVTGSTAVVTSAVDGTYSSVDANFAFDTGAINIITYYIDVYYTELVDGMWFYLHLDPALYIYGEYNSITSKMWLTLYGALEGDLSAEILSFAANKWYRIKIEFDGTSTTVKVWRRDEESEPSPLLTGTYSGLIAFYGGFYDIGIGNSLTNTVEIDNVNIYTDGYIITHGTGQAQALLLGATWGSGQAMASITKKMGHGQALADIKKTTRAFGQARAQIGGQQRRGQARAYIIKGRLSVSGQAQAFIWDNQIATGLALAWIIKPQPTGQAMAKIIGSIQQRFGLAQAKILAKTITYAHGQAMGIVKGPAFGQAAALIAGAKYLVRYNGYDLPGYAQEETIDSVSRLKVNGAPYVDGSLSEYLGLENKLISLRMKAIGQTYADVKNQAQKAATILNSSKGFTKLYIQYWDRYYEAMAKSIKMDKSVGSSMRLAEYTVEFEAKPWLTSTFTTTISGTGLLDTDIINRTIDNGGWTPAILRISGTNVTVSGYTATGYFAGYISISGAVTNFEINTNEYDTTDNSVMKNADYAMYVGPGKTYFNVTGATSCVISWQDRWYL